MNSPIGASEYFDYFPSNDHTPGDVWTHFPTFGILPFTRTPALVITPACDLANRKVEAVTFVPIVAVNDFLTARDHLPDILRATEGQLIAAGVTLRLQANSNDRVNIGSIDSMCQLLNETIAARPGGQKEAVAKARAECGLAILRSILAGVSLANRKESVKSLYGEKEFSSLCARVVRNSLRSDIHFLPCDQQPTKWSALNRHSVALFRYPLTVPLEFLDLSLVTPDRDWQSVMSAVACVYPCSAAFSAYRPMKMLRVRSRFMSDLLSRFISLYGRIGSPDFSPGTVDDYVNHLSGESHELPRNY